MRVFLRTEDGPVASGDDPVASEPTLGYIMAVDPVVRDLWRDHASEIKRLCAPSMPKRLIDQQEVLGFALADGLGRPLLPHGEARTVGQAADDAMRNAKGTKAKPGPLTRAKEAAREAVRKATRKAEKDESLVRLVADAEKEGAGAVAAVLAKPCSLKLPNATAGSKRKRVRFAADPAPATEAAEPRAWDAVTEKMAALRAAEAASSAAVATADADARRYERARRGLQAAQADLEGVSYSSSRWDELSALCWLREDAAGDAIDASVESRHAAVEACCAEREARYELELALMRDRAELAEGLARSEQAFSDRLLELHGGRWRCMQETQTEEQPTGQVVWGRAERWEPGEEDPWVVDEGEEGEAGEEGEEGAWEWWVPQQRLALRGVDMPWADAETCEERWDDETAARAAEEMRLTSAARCRADGLSAGSCSEGA